MRMITFMKYTVLPVILLFFIMPQTVSAVPSFTASPLVIDIDAEARDILTHEITIKNTGSAPLTVYPTVNNISLDEGGTIQEFLPPVESDRTASLSSWIEISRAGIKLPRGESKTIPITIRINPNPIPGEYHAFIGFGFGRNRDEAEQLVRIGRAPGTVVTVAIKDNRSELLKLSRFIVDRFITSGKNESAVYTINNPGDKELVPTGEIIFYNNRGAEVASLVVNPERESIAPGAQKEFNAEVPANGLFGKYKAFLSVEYGSQLASVQDTAFFYVFPMTTIFIILGVILVLVSIGAIIVHRRYIDEAVVDDSVQLPLHIRETHSDAKDHDIDLKQ